MFQCDTNGLFARTDLKMWHNTGSPKSRGGFTKKNTTFALHLWRHNFGHNDIVKASSIMPAKWSSLWRNFSIMLQN